VAEIAGALWISPREGSLPCAGSRAQDKHRLFAVCHDLAHGEHFLLIFFIFLFSFISFFFKNSLPCVPLLLLQVAHDKQLTTFYISILYFFSLQVYLIN
jgi:hypothetical protein